jgi:hypothetical protein
MDIKYNIYYSFRPEGPWTLSNSTPIDHVDDTEMDYTVSGLNPNSVYYISVVGGYMDGTTFIPLISQPVGPVDDTVETNVSGDSIGFRTFSPLKTSNGVLTHTFSVGS